VADLLLESAHPNRDIIVGRRQQRLRIISLRVGADTPLCVGVDVANFNGDVGNDTATRVNNSSRNFSCCLSPTAYRPGGEREDQSFRHRKPLTASTVSHM